MISIPKKIEESIVSRISGENWDRIDFTERVFSFVCSPYGDLYFGGFNAIYKFEIEEFKFRKVYELEGTFRIQDERISDFA